MISVEYNIRGSITYKPKFHFGKLYNRGREAWLLNCLLSSQHHDVRASVAQWIIIKFFAHGCVKPAEILGRLVAQLNDKNPLKGPSKQNSWMDEKSSKIG